MTPIPPIPEDLPEICKEYCKDCGAETATWFTDSDIWNLLDTPGILCPNCFVHLIEARGFATTGWKLVPEERIAKLTAALDAFMELPHLFDDVCDRGANCKVCRAIELARATRTPPQEGQ